MNNKEEKYIKQGQKINIEGKFFLEEQKQEGKAV